MLTSDSRVSEISDGIISGKFSVTLTSVSLKSEKETLQGKGLLRINDERCVELLFFNDRIVSRNEVLVELCKQSRCNPEGWRLTDSDYWSMSGTDTNDFVVRCSRMNTHYVTDSVMLFLAKDTIEYETGCLQSSAVCIGSYKIPYSDSVASIVKGDGFFYTITEDYFQIKFKNGLSARVHATGECLYMIISHKGNIDTETIRDMIHSLEFVFGLNLGTVLISIKDVGFFISSDTADDGLNSNYDAPISRGNLYSRDFCENHKRMASAYFNYLQKDSLKLLPICHKRVISSRASYLYVFSLTLSTQVETLVKAYYSKYYTPDIEKNSIIDKGINEIGNWEITQDYKQLLQNILSNAKDGNTVKVMKVLRILAEQNVISGAEMVKSWNSLRNRTAHGDYPCTEGPLYDKWLQEYYDCLNLYHQLVFNLIGYSGKYTHYGLEENHLDEYNNINSQLTQN